MMRKATFGGFRALALSALLLFPTTAIPTATEATGSPTACPGDCNGDGRVTVNELVIGVAIQLERQKIESCPAMDTNDNGRVTVNELVQAVNALLAGCPAPFTVYGQSCVGVHPVWVGVADLDGSGTLDVIAVNRDTNDVSLLDGDGTGGFTGESRVVVGGSPRAAASRDLDDDGVLDLPDVNGDGQVDLVTANRDTNDVSVLHGDGDGAFVFDRVVVSSDARPHAVEVADLDADGNLDALVASASPNTGRLRVFFSFTTQVGHLVGDEPRDVRVVDLNGDQRLDIVLANIRSFDIAVLMNLGDGVLSDRVLYATGENPRDIAIADLDDDGAMDVVTANQDSGDVSVLLGDGQGGFAPTRNFSAGVGTRAVAVADVNGDGDLDAIAIAQGSNEVIVLLGGGDGTLRALAPIELPTSDCPDEESDAAPKNLALGDLNGDGRLDVVVANSNGDSVTVLLHKGP